MSSTPNTFIQFATSSVTNTSRRRLALIMAAIFFGSANASMAANVIVNGSFEVPTFSGTTVQQVNDSFVPGWKTSATNNLIEFWANGNNNVFAAAGNQHVELNATQVSTLYQDVSGIPANSMVGYSFAHRGRLGPDTMALRIGDLGTDNAPGGVGSAADTILFNQQFTTGANGWVQYSAPTIGPLAIGNNMRFSFVSIAATGGNQAIGNFLDNVSFGVGVPEPTACLLLVCGTLGLVSVHRRR